MQTKLTLQLEDDLIQQIETYAKNQNKFISQLVADYFQQLMQQTKHTPIPPICENSI